MSGDEIQFEEVRTREPQKLRRPDRDRRYATLAYGLPAGEGPDLPIYLDRLAADAIERHALRDTRVELGGILLGRECLDDLTGEPFVWISRSLEAKHYENTQASFTYTHDSWEEITRERDRLHPDLDIVGWYHTHPDFGIFLSSLDLFIHRNFFPQPLQVAYVVDPIRQERGFFRWRGRDVSPVGGFYVLADRSDRNALARLVNDLEQVPNAEASGSLSPRLEAELIAMLSRPSLPQPLPSSPMLPMVALIVGTLLGMFGFWTVAGLRDLKEELALQRDVLNRIEADEADEAYLALELLSTATKGEVPIEDFVGAELKLSAKRRDAETRATQAEKVGKIKDKQILDLNQRLAASEATAEERGADLKKAEAELKEYEEIEKAARDAGKGGKAAGWVNQWPKYLAGGMTVVCACLVGVWFSTWQKLKDLQATLPGAPTAPGSPPATGPMRPGEPPDYRIGG